MGGLAAIAPFAFVILTEVQAVGFRMISVREETSETDTLGRKLGKIPSSQSPVQNSGKTPA